MLQNLARSIIHRYPAAWRERYANEVLDLIDSAPVCVYDVGELFRNMLVEQVRATVDVDRPSEADGKVMRYKAVAVGTFVVLTQLAGWALWWGRGLSESEIERVLSGVLPFYAILGAIWCTHAVRQKGKASDERAPFPAVVALVCLPLHLIASACWVWVLLASPSGYSPRWMQLSEAVYHSLYLGGVAAWLMMQIWPGQRLVRLLTEFQMADGAVAGAQAYIVSCEKWIDKGVMSPLADARKALEERLRERDAVRERINLVANRSRFKRP